jgi:prepilin-type N-terminal cleavage/methylation domain-containing protein
MFGRAKLDKEFFSTPPSLTHRFCAGNTPVQHGSGVFTIYSLYTLEHLLAEKRAQKEDPVVRFLVDLSGVVWFARETRPNNQAPKHYQMTGEPLSSAYCATAGTIKFKNSSCTTLKSINHRSGDFHPSFHSLRLFLTILILHEDSLPFKLPKNLIIKEYTQEGTLRYKHKWPVTQIKKWVADFSTNPELINPLKRQARKHKIVRYEAVYFFKNEAPLNMLGFTLIEHLFVLLIIGILTSIAYPTVTHLLRKTRRSEATITLIQDQMKLEHCYAQNTAYNQPCDSLPVFPHTSLQGYYEISLTNLEAKTYRLIALPKDSQSMDATCAQFTIDQAHFKTALDSAGSMQPICWDPIA